MVDSFFKYSLLTLLTVLPQSIEVKMNRSKNELEIQNKFGIM